LQHIFPEQKEAVQSDLSQKSGLEKNQVLNLLIQLAPLVLGILGNQKEEQGDQGDITGLIGNALGMMGNQQPAQQSNQSGFQGLLGNLLKAFLTKK